jgi:co-chaperonin GroES (HSP10)
MALKPVFGNLLIERVVEEKLSDSGLAVPEGTDTVVKGRVIEIPTTGTPLGDGRVLPVEVREEMYVYFIPEDAERVTVNGKTLYIIDQRQIRLVEDDF